MLIYLSLCYHCLFFVCLCTKKKEGQNEGVLPELRFNDWDAIKLKLLSLNIL